jgi:hypothetical protein
VDGAAVLVHPSVGVGGKFCTGHLYDYTVLVVMKIIIAWVAVKNMVKIGTSIVITHVSVIVTLQSN